MNSIDLHGIKHRDATSIIDSFIRQNKDNLPIEVITGNSIDMQSILRKVVNNYNLKIPLHSKGTSQPKSCSC